MRVTKRIEEYIQEQVEAHVVDERLNELKDEEKAMMKRFEELTQELNADYLKKCSAILTECGLTTTNYCKQSVHLARISTILHSGNDSHLIPRSTNIQEIIKRESDLQTRRKNAVKDIILKLELGGTMKDLEAMFNEL